MLSALKLTYTFLIVVKSLSMQMARVKARGVRFHVSERIGGQHCVSLK